MEVTQFTYFQQVGGFECRPVTGELTYGLERLAMYIQGVDNVFDLRFNNEGVTYRDVFLENEIEMSTYNFEVADTGTLFDSFRKAADECERCLEAKLPIPAYEQAIKASHVFNTLQARGVISVAERQAYIGRVRDLAKAACGAWMDVKGYPACWPTSCSSFSARRSRPACRRGRATILRGCLLKAQARPGWRRAQSTPIRRRAGWC